MYGRCTDEALYFKNGYYWNWNDSKITENSYRQFIANLQITGGNYDSQTAALSFSLPLPNRCLNQKVCRGELSFRCLEGYRGFLCAGCDVGFQRIGFTCIPCPNKITIIITISSVTALVLGLTTAIVFRVNRAQSTQSPLLDSILSNGKICINFFYINSKLLKALSFVNWPGIITDISKYVSVISFDPISMIAMQCSIGKFDMFARFKFFMFSNVIVSGVTLVGLVVIQFSLGLQKTKHLAKEALICSLRKSLIGVASMTLFLLYPSTASAVFGILPFACKRYYLTQNGDASADYFLEDPSIRCFTDIHMKHVTISYISLIYVFGMPILVPLILYFTKNRDGKNMGDQRQAFRIRHQLQAMLRDLSASPNESQSGMSIGSPVTILNEQRHLSDLKSISGPITYASTQKPVSFKEDVRNGLCFYHANYKDMFFFWESVEMLRKVLLSSVTVSIGGSSRTSICLLVMFSGIFSVLHAQFKPIKRTTEHILQLLALFAIFSNLIIGLSMRLSSEMDDSTSKQESLALTVIILACNGWIIIAGITLTIGT